MLAEEAWRGWTLKLLSIHTGFSVLSEVSLTYSDALLMPLSAL